MTPLVLVHGFGTSRHIWRRVLGEVEALVVDLPGFGDAAYAGRAGQTVEDMAQALTDMLREVGEGPYRVAAHSMGGKVALLLAARNPELVSELFLIAPSPPTPEPMDPEGRAKLRAAHGNRDALNAQYHGVTVQPIPEQDFAQLVQDGLRASHDAWTAWPDVGSREDISGELDGLNLPITVLFSEDDPAISPDTIRSEVLARFPQAKAVAIHGSGHLIPLEQPEAVISLLQAEEERP
ncbi:alpha/beta fold hydrolase [Deinococcus arenicola]|uniref:Alpha/beta hydrolase n=1 Tax=Deinococcus arenicola TaxID=2994950 RepID=A0ABU4DPX1_9DEIO|nr:alpha/beta hydrolase [Deinococcus sp. ZS9-10]MDV6374477.1 alpha/beta hydrolase [Deinococcus sp. ZS9-10]